MSTFQEQVESLVGAIPATLPTGIVNQSMSDGMQDIVKKVEVNRREDLWMFTQTSDVTASGLAVDSGRIIDVERGGNPCKPVEARLRHRAAQADSISYASGEFPLFYTLNSKVHILPTPGDATVIQIDMSNNSGNVAGFTTYNSGDQTLVTCNAAHGYASGDQVQILQSDAGIGMDSEYVGMHYVTVASDTTFVLDKDFTAVPFDAF